MTKTIQELKRMAFTGIILCVLTGLAGCQTMYYSTMEKFGIEKRDILVERVDEARESQQEAKEQFESALDQFIAVTNYQGGDLEDQYRRLKNEYEDSVDRADEVSSRIDDVERVAEDLFNEWTEELELYSSSELRRSSERQLKSTQIAYKKLITAMRRAEKKIQPVLVAFQDRVLFLKHNLNANAIASLRNEKKTIESNISALVRDMNISIEEADKFIAEMSG